MSSENMLAVGDRAERLVSEELKEQGIRHTYVNALKWWLDNEPLGVLRSPQRRPLRSRRSLTTMNCAKCEKPIVKRGVFLYCPTDNLLFSREYAISNYQKTSEQRWLVNEPLKGLHPEQQRWLRLAQSLFSSEEQRIRSLFTDFENILYETNRKPRFNRISRTWMFKDESAPHPKSLMGSRYPDFIGKLRNGQTVFIEVKTRSSELSKDQRTFMKMAKERRIRNPSVSTQSIAVCFEA